MSTSLEEGCTAPICRFPSELTTYSSSTPSSWRIFQARIWIDHVILPGPWVECDLLHEALLAVKRTFSLKGYPCQERCEHP
jgi:hypothetical protein